MGLCHGKPTEPPKNISENPIIPSENNEPTINSSTGKTPKFPFYSPSPLRNVFKNSPANSSSSVNSTPLRFFKRPFPPPSPAKHIKALLARRHGSVKPNEASIPEGSECEIVGLDKNFGFSKNFASHYSLGEEVGRGHFGYTCSATGKKGALKGQDVAVKVIPKSKVLFIMTQSSFVSIGFNLCEHIIHCLMYVGGCTYADLSWSCLYITLKWRVFTDLKVVTYLMVIIRMLI